jgi:putative transposase
VTSAIRERQPDAGLIHHTDRGGQYASKRYRDVLRRCGMQLSMNATPNCCGNAFMASCFGTVKAELELVEYDSGRYRSRTAPVLLDRAQ